MRVIVVYRMWLYLFPNTFYMVSNTKNKSSENLNFHPILGTNFTYGRYSKHAVWEGQIPCP